MTSQLTIHCPTCQTIIPDNSKFCQQCGSTISLPNITCKLCGTKNDTSAIYCLSCGSDLKTATLGITAGRATEWNEWLKQNYRLYNEWVGANGIAMKLWEECHKFMEQYPIKEKKQLCAFLIPIKSIDWCIKSLGFKGIYITYGLFIGGETDLSIYNLSSSTVQRIPYNQINGYHWDLNNWVLTINLIDGNSVRLEIKKSSTAFATTLLIGDLFSSFSQSSGDAELSRQGTKRVTDGVVAKYENARKLWGSITEFFNEVLSHDENRKLT